MKEKLGDVQNKSERDPLDFYATNPKDIREIVELLGLDKRPTLKVLEPCAGDGHIVKVLSEEYGIHVTTNDIVQRDFPLDHVVDFLVEDLPYNKDIFDVVLTNPPFKLAKEFIERSLEYAPVVIVIARLDLLESHKRKDLNNNHLSQVFVHTARAKFAKGGDDELFKKGTAMSTGWFIYTRNKNKQTQLRII